MSETRGYVDSHYLKTIGEFVQRDKQRTYEVMQIEPGHHVLDVGCGPGTDTISLAQFVGSTGLVVGVDYDAAMIAEANQRAAQAGLTERLRHYQADAAVLPLEANIFDASRSERLFQHVPDPTAVLKEMVRVTKPGRPVVVFDTDWGTASTDTSEVELEGRWNRYYAERFLQNGFSGRMLYRLFKEQGLMNIHIEMRPVSVTSWLFARHGTCWDQRAQGVVADGVMTADEVQRLERSFEQAEVAGTFFASLSLVLATGCKPATFQGR